jgi:5-methylcytosine-specific restriction endonuclease McrA
VPSRAGYWHATGTREYNAERVRKWRAEHPERAFAARTAASANRRARLVGATGTLTVGDVLVLFERQPGCVSCGDGRGLDHIVSMSLGGANEPANLQNLCPPCNTSKGRHGAEPRRRRAA